MNKQETIKIIAIIKTVYTKFFISESRKEAELQTETWQSLFSDEPYPLVEQAVKALMCTLKFPPTIADIKEKIALITQPQANTELEAWGKVLKAIQNSNYNAKEMFDNLPNICKKIIGSHNQLREWAVLDIDDLQTVVSSNFMRSYRAIVAQEKEYNMLPESAKKLKSLFGEERKMIADGENI